MKEVLTVMTISTVLNVMSLVTVIVLGIYPLITQKEFKNLSIILFRTDKEPRSPWKCFLLNDMVTPSDQPGIFFIRTERNTVQF